MHPLILEKLRDYADRHIVDFHRQRIHLLDEMRLDRLFPLDVYFFTAKNTSEYAGELIATLLNSYLSPREEELFEGFLKGLAVYTAEMIYAGHKSIEPGVDLEFINHGTYYVMCIEAESDLGNSFQQDKLEEDLISAATRIKQAKQGIRVQPVFGICCGKTRTSYLRGYMKVAGQNFWYLISGNRNLYTEIIELISYRAGEHNETFAVEKGKATNRLTRQFIEQFCDESGAIEWPKLAEFSSGNFDLDDFLP